MPLANAAVQESKLSWLLVIIQSQLKQLLKELESFQKVKNSYALNDIIIFLIELKM